jgi:Holliday junction resolvase RusA-like endonuclease
MLEITWLGVPPTKKNSQVALNRGKFATIVPSSAVQSFERQVASLFKLAMRDLGHTVEWSIPEGKKKPYPLNPIFQGDVCVSIVTTYKWKRHPDVDGPPQAILDAGTQAGIWYDDKQVKEIHSKLRSGKDNSVQVRVFDIKVESGWYSPSPFTRREWYAQDMAEEAIPKEPRMVLIYCQKCGAAMGRGCVQDSVWLLPKKNHLGWKLEPICGACADHLNLSHQYRVLSSDELKEMEHFEAMLTLNNRRKDLLGSIRQRKPSRSRRIST